MRKKEIKSLFIIVFLEIVIVMINFFLFFFRGNNWFIKKKLRVGAKILKRTDKEIGISKPIQDSNKNTESIDGDIILPTCYAASLDEDDYVLNKK
jgi:hypothetical protein